MDMSMSIGLRGAPSRLKGVGVVPSLILDFVNNIYTRNGVVYGSYVALLAAGGGSFSRASAGYDLKGSQSFPVDAPRIGVDGLLLEPGATNLTLQSMLASGWSATNATATPNAAVAPDGTTTALTLKEDATAAAAHEIGRQQAASALANVRYINSAYMKRTVGTRQARDGLFANDFSGAAYAFPNLAGGLAIPSSSYGAGWTSYTTVITAGAQSYDRVAQPFTPPGNAGYWTIVSMSDGSGNVTYSGDNTSTIALWGMQLELAAAGGYYQSNASSLIATGAASATRATDANSLNVPAGKTTATLTYSDATTQNVAVTGGGTLDLAATVFAHVAANNRAPVLRSVTFS